MNIFRQKTPYDISPSDKVQEIRLLSQSPEHSKAFDM